MTFETLKQKAHSTPHSATCCRGSEDTYEVVYGKRDPDCPRCKLDDKARTIAAARMF